MGGCYYPAPPMFDKKRVKKNSKKNKKAKELCHLINIKCRGFNSDIASFAGLIQIHLEGGIKPEYAPYEVSDEDLAKLEGIAFQVS
jgi:hypothetical protein